MSSSQCARLLEEKGKTSQYEERWDKYIEILGEAKQEAQAMTEELQIKISNYEQMLEKLVLLKRDLEKDKNQYEARLEHWNELITIGTTFVMDTEKIAAEVSQDMSLKSLELADKVFNSNVVKWDVLDYQQKELNKSMKTLEASHHLLEPKEAEQDAQLETGEKEDEDITPQNYLQMLTLFRHYAGQVPERVLTTLSSVRSNHP